MNNVWMKSGVLFVYGASLDTQFHAHNAIQIIWPSEDSCLQVAGSSIHEAVIVDANVPHQLQMKQGWVVLVEPQSQLGEDLKARLKTHDVERLSGLEPFGFHCEPALLDPIKALLPLFQSLFLHIESEDDLTGYVQLVNGQQLDGRIERLLNNLNACFKGTCLKPEKWRAASVASDLALSESRFLHVFKAQMGIAWRPFLLWRRMLCAVNMLMTGDSATHAAYVAGFSDSAHLSRSFRAMFGMNIRQATQLLDDNSDTLKK